MYILCVDRIGHCTKGGANAVEVVRHLLPLVQQMHLNDWNGKDQALAGYCPMGEGVVDTPAILNFMEGWKIRSMVTAQPDDLDACHPDPTPPHHLHSITVRYLKSIGVQLRT